MIRNRASRDDAMERRRLIFGIARSRTQADPRLTIDAYCAESGLSRSSVKRHLAWLRQNGFMSPSGSFTPNSEDGEIASHDETSDSRITR
jgi:hypothetical protein